MHWLLPRSPPLGGLDSFRPRRPNLTWPAPDSRRGCDSRHHLISARRPVCSFDDSMHGKPALLRSPGKAAERPRRFPLQHNANCDCSSPRQGETAWRFGSSCFSGIRIPSVWLRAFGNSRFTPKPRYENFHHKPSSQSFTVVEGQMQPGRDPPAASGTRFDPPALGSNWIGTPVGRNERTSGRPLRLVHQLYPFRHEQSVGDHSRARWKPLVRELLEQVDRTDYHERHDHDVLQWKHR